jgi:hypothetical protein
VAFGNAFKFLVPLNLGLTVRCFWAEFEFMWVAGHNSISAQGATRLVADFSSK